MDFKVDPVTRDIVFEDGDFVLLTGLDAIEQELDICLQTFLGEWFLDTRIGMPWFQSLLGAKPRLAALLSIFRDGILQVSGIIAVHNLNADFAAQTRTLSVTFTAIAAEGVIEYDREFII